MKAIILLLFFSAQVCCAQMFTIKEISKMEGAYIFPVVQSAQRPDLAKKMNTIIQTEIGVDPDLADPFETLHNEDEYSYTLGSANSNTLSPLVTGAHTGAGNHVTRKFLNFDSQTGTLREMNFFFSSEGLENLRKTLFKSWKKIVTENVKTDYRAEEYKACLTESAGKTALDDVDHMLVKDQSVAFWAGWCLDGSNYEYDNSKGPHELSFGQLLPMLTANGYALLFGKAPAGPVKTLLRGLVGEKYPISLTIFEGAGNAVGGLIVYDRVGGVINLNGERNGNQFMLHEIDETGKAVSNIELVWDGTKLTGSFINLKAKKQMTFVAAPVAAK